MLSALFGRDTEVRAQASTWGTWPGESSPTGTQAVTQTTAMQLLAVYGCVSYVADQISTLPVDVFRTDPAGQRVEQTPPAWLKQPTIDLNFTDWCSQVLVSLLLHGNSYCAITRNQSNQIVEIQPLDPSVITVHRVPGGLKKYHVAGRPWSGEMLHIKGKMAPGADVGMSPLECARRSIGLGLEAVDFGADNFQQSLNMPGVIELPTKAQPDVMREMGRAWRAQRQGKRNRGLPGVLESGAQWKPTGVTNEQAQFLQTRQWTAAEIAGQVFLIDPVELGIPVSGSSITYGNMEQRAIASFRRGFQPHVIRIEQALSALLPQPRFVKFNIAGLLRADSSARWTVYEAMARINAAAVAIGMDPVFTTEEMRDLEDYGPIDLSGMTPPAAVPAPSI